jgi:predicted glycoside hydrolase/deacetylase ChbG (UPF0249 family)
MDPNPLLKKLGYSNTDRVVILHTDDIGMCQASLDAYFELWDYGLISSGAVMVPCPWFPATAAACRAKPGVDLGVHLTLTCEWDAFRWGPLSTCDPHTGLLDSEGYMHRTSEAVQENADPQAVKAEIRAQLARALDAGIDVTHIDMHMGTVGHPRFVADYVQLAAEQRLPPFLPRMDAAGFHRYLGLEPEAAAFAATMVRQLEEAGIPLIDSMDYLPLDQPAERVAQAKQRLGVLSPGVHHFLMHPAKDTPELRAIADDWRSRVADFEAFRSDELRTFVRSNGIQVIGYRALRNVFRGAAS